VQPGTRAAVKDGRPARVQAMSVLGRSHRFVCPTGDLNPHGGGTYPNRGSITSPS